jgi:ATP phosphoribosyltransferase
MNDNLIIAVQKSGRLQEGSLALLKECGLRMSNGSRKLRTVVNNFPAEILFLRDDDIPQYVEDGVADIGIVGENVVREKDKQVEIVERLNFAKCRLSLAIPREIDYPGLSWFNNKKIATSYSVILQKFLDENKLSAEIHGISGSVEVAPSIGLGDAICDIVSTGSTLMSNGLKEVEHIFKSEAVLISGSLGHEKSKLLNELNFRIQSVNTGRKHRYLLMNAPNESIERISQVLPGMKSPTITPLGQEGWSSIHSVVEEDIFWEKIDQLKSLGAQGILVIPIEKMIV